MSQKSYYAIIPANVRYDDNLSNGAKLLFGEITALSNETGYCWASNSYFASLYKTSERTISRWVSELAIGGHIMTLVDNEKGNSRQIWLAESQRGIDKNVHRVTTKMSKGSRQKCPVGIDKNVQQNNTVNNTVNNTMNSVNAPAQNSTTLKTETLPPTPQSSAAPPAPAPYTFAGWLESLKEDYTIRESFTITQKIPSQFFDDYLTRFTALAKTQPEKYARRHDLTGHFLNWSRTQYQAAQTMSSAPITRKEAPVYGN